MPTRSDLPEPLWPLLRRNALELDNSHWDYDVERLLSAVSELVGTPAPTPESSPAPAPTVHGGSRLRALRRRPRLVAGVVGAVVAAVAAVAIALASGGSSNPALLSATAAVARVHPEALVQSMVYGQRLSQPLGVAGAPVRFVTLDAAQVMNGMAALIAVGLGGPDAVDDVYYHVFTSAANATTFRTHYQFPAPFQVTGVFSLPGVADPSSCITGLETQGGSITTQSRCLVQSAYVVTEVVDQTTGTEIGTQAARSLARASLRQLALLAADTPRTPAAGSSLSPGRLAARLLTTAFTPRETLVYHTFPPVLSAPVYSNRSIGSSSPRGLRRELQIVFTGPDRAQFLEYWIFDSAAHADAFFGPANGGVSPTGFTKTGAIDASGFSDRTECAAFKGPTAQSSGTSQCYSIADNVMVVAATDGAPGSSGGDSNLTVTMQRMALLHLYRVLGRHY
jgi:hypothetical protein